MVLTSSTAFVLAAVEGLLKGVVVWAVVGVVVSYATIRLQGDSLPTSFTNDTIVSFTSRTVSLLVGFLVVHNINTALKINATVAAIQGACMELVSLSHALLSTNNSCNDESLCLAKLTVFVMQRAVRSEAHVIGEVSVPGKIFEGFKAVKRAKDVGAIEAPLVGVLSSTLSKIGTKYDSLQNLRNSGTPPSIRFIVYVLGVVNIVQYVMSMQDDDDATRIAVGTFISIATIGVLTTSSSTCDPLDSGALSYTLRTSVETTIKEIGTIDRRCSHTSPIGTQVAVTHAHSKEGAMFSQLLEQPIYRSQCPPFPARGH
tara:strand:- start:130 stop:1074 length:945 start_codon:yes stop_codon:yes gene_type:complete